MPLTAWEYSIISQEKKSTPKHAPTTLRTWFTDPKLGMNPNMTYAQAVPGMKKMRGSGFIDSRRFSRALGVAKLIEGSKSWTPSDKKKTR